MFLPLFILAGGVAGFLAYCTTKPDTFRVERKITIDSSASKIFPLINDFHNWAEWSPYEKMDPDMKKNFSGKDKGKGSIYSWDGNNKVGAGRMEITESTSPSLVRTSLQFMRPMKFHNTGEFLLEKKGDQTEVTWAMYGPNPFFNKVMHTLINMDKLVGKDFEIGLENLKNISEK